MMMMTMMMMDGHLDARAADVCKLFHVEQETCV